SWVVGSEDDLSTYLVKRGTTNDPDLASNQTVCSSSTGIFHLCTDGILSSTVSYYYFVSAKDQAGNQSPYSIVGPVRARKTSGRPSIITSSSNPEVMSR